jgi:hypothetical protein
MSKYAIGERWYCDRSASSNPYNRQPFYFVIADASRPGYKMCRIEVEGRLEMDAHEYSHKHLNKYAVHVPKETNK